MKMGPTGFPETAETDGQLTPRNLPEDRRYKQILFLWKWYILRPDRETSLVMIYNWSYFPFVLSLMMTRSGGNM